MQILDHCDALDPSECDCCDHSYDAGRFNATIYLARKMRLPWDWSLREALEVPITQAWLAEHFLPTQQQILDTGSPRWENYPIRQAALAVAVVSHAPWSTSGRRGSAWALTRAGMLYHHWKLSPKAWADASTIADPPEDFWATYDDLRVLSELLDRAYEYCPPNENEEAADPAR